MILDRFSLKFWSKLIIMELGIAHRIGAQIIGGHNSQSSYFETDINTSLQLSAHFQRYEFSFFSKVEDVELVVFYFT